MEVQLTDEEIKEVDFRMGEHMYGHSISNSYANFACSVGCRTRALGEIINKVLLDKPEEVTDGAVPSPEGGS